MKQQMDLARAGRSLDPVGAVDEVAGARLHSEAVECVFAKRGLGSFTKIGRDLNLAHLEGALKRGFQLSLAICRVELASSDSDPGAATRGPGANIGCNASIGAERQANELVLRALAARKNARPLRDVRLTVG
jgi:hypothetical protein